jgi:nitrogenase molybdenum-iron protein alpha chain
MSCATSKAICTVALIQDVAVISHGPLGCGARFHEYAFTYQVNGKKRGVPEPKQIRVFSSDMREEDTIYGGAEKLRDAIQEVYERVRPRAIFIVTTCASGIIGDDVEGAANEAQEELGIPVSAIFCEGFRSRIWTTGFDAGYHGIVRKLVRPSPMQPSEEKNPNLVNIVNFWGSDVFSRWFRAIGLEPNYLTPYATLESLADAAKAVVTVQICPTLGSYMGAALEQACGVPELTEAPPYGIPQTERWFKALGRATGREAEAESFLEKERAEWLPRFEKLKKSLQGKTAYVTAGAAHGHAMLAILKEYGMETLGAGIFHHDSVYDNPSESLDALKTMVGDYGDVKNYTVCNRQEYELVNLLNRLKPDIFVARHGGIVRWGARLGIPALLVEDEHYGMGYEGLVRYGRRVLHTIENVEFIRNFSRHAKIPYSEKWLASDPYTFLNADGHGGD